MVADSWYGPQLPGYYAPGAFGPQLPDYAGYRPRLEPQPPPRFWDLFEDETRRLVPGTFLDDFVVGSYRILTNRVGKDGNPTYHEAYGDTDHFFSGLLPGGEKPRVPDFIADPLAKYGPLLLVGAAGVAGLAVVLR